MNIRVYVSGAPLYAGEARQQLSSIEAVRDTTGKGKGLRVLWKGTVVGHAISMKKDACHDQPALVYDVVLDGREFKPNRAERLHDGFLGTIRGAMWTSGLYPTAITIVSASSRNPLPEPRR